MAIAKVILNGVTQMDVTQKTVTAASMLNGTTALKNDGTDITGNIASKTSSDLTVSGGTVTAPAGYYSSNASKAVSSMTLPSSTSTSSSGTSKATISRNTADRYLNIPAGYNASAQYYTISGVPDGSAGTPTATKGTVSNHSISVTPSVTNTTGYITGGTKTGTAVTVSASELVSGSQTLENNDTYDVTNLASVTVNVSGSGSATHTCTIETGSNSSSVYVSYNNTMYYTAGDEFTFSAGDNLYMYANGRTSGGTIRVNDVTVASTSTTSANYNYTLPDADIHLIMSTGSTGTIYLYTDDGGYKFIGHTAYIVNTSSTTPIDVGTFATGNTSIWTSNKIVYVKIRDSAGRRNGYYYGTDAFIMNNTPGNNLPSTSNYLVCGTVYQQNSAGYLVQPVAIERLSLSHPDGPGIYPDTIYDDGSIAIKAKYDNSLLTINGTFYVNVYLLDWPAGINPFQG